MKTYRMNAMMAGGLYVLGTVFGVTSAIVGGEVLSSTISGKPLEGVDMLVLVSANATQLTASAFFILMMGISLTAMTVFLYPIFKKDSEELAAGMLLFRGALEGTWYILVTLGILSLVSLGNEYVAAGANLAALQSMGNVLYKFQDFIGPVGTLVFLVGAACLYVSFYRTRLIPRWLSIWGLIGMVPYLAYALLHFFNMDNGIGLYFQIPLAIQEIVMGLWLLIAGFNMDAVKKLDEAH
jgi:hypothetical protein